MMAAISTHSKYVIKLVAYFTVAVFAQTIPHELGHAMVAKLLGYQIMGFTWNLFDPSFVSINLSSNPALFRFVLVSGGWGAALFFLVVHRLSHDLALRKISRIFILYGFLGGLFEAYLNHVYVMVLSLSYLLLGFCIVVVFTVDIIAPYFKVNNAPGICKG